MKKILSVILSVIMCLGVFNMFAGCAKVSPNSPSDLEITVWDSGMGKEYLDKAIEAFSAKNPEINITLNSSADINTPEITSGEGSNTVDLYFSCYDVNFNKKIIEPLNDVVNSKADGESLTIGEKLDPKVLDTMTNIDGNTYSLPFGSGMGGLLYNKTEFDARGYKVPRTTKELANLCEKMLIDDGLTPFIYLPAYWNLLTKSWAAQYDGIEDNANYNSYRFKEGDNWVEHDIRVPTSEDLGRYKAVEVLDELLSPSGYAYAGSNSLPFTTSQEYFLNGKAMMIPNGTWIENEMKKTETKIEYRMMKTPVISSLAKKIGITEKQLSAVVAEIDGETLNDAQKSELSGVSTENKERVKQVRNVFVTNITGMNTFIPKYAVAKDAAKKFLTFFYSDQNMQIYEKSLKMNFPANYSNPDIVTNTDNWSDFQKDNSKLFKDMAVLDDESRGDGIALKGVIGELKLATYGIDPVQCFSTTSTLDKKTLSQWWSSEKKFWNDNFDRWLDAANLK